MNYKGYKGHKRSRKDFCVLCAFCGFNKCEKISFKIRNLENEQIDILKLKVNPLILEKKNKDIWRFKKSFQLNLFSSEKYEEGLIINSYKIKY